MTKWAARYVAAMVLSVSAVAVARDASTNAGGPDSVAGPVVGRTATRGFRIVKKKILHAPRWTSTIEYPVIGDSIIDSDIREFAKECYNPGEFIVDDGRCSQIVTANIVRGDYLVLKLESADYAAGQAHGEDSWSYKTYRRAYGNWIPVRNSFISQNAECQGRVAAILDLQVKPQLSDAQLQGDQGAGGALEAASQVITDRGVTFEYQQYAFGSYAPPTPVTVSYRVLGACFEPQLASAGRP